MKSPRTIVVTGASGGIGMPLCTSLAKGGAFLILCGRDHFRLGTLAEKLRLQNGIRPMILTFDFGVPESIRNAVTKLKARTNALDGFAMIPPRIAACSDCTPHDQEWRSLFEENFIGPLSLIRGCLPLLSRRKRSKVVLVSALSSTQLVPKFATSGVIRAAWQAEIKALAFAHGAHGVHFNTVSLGSVLTSKNLARLKRSARRTEVNIETLMKAQTANVPLARYAAPENVALVLETMLSGFSDHLTGVNILCDGGFTRSYR